MSPKSNSARPTSSQESPSGGRNTTFLSILSDDNQKKVATSPKNDG